MEICKRRSDIGNAQFAVRGQVLQDIEPQQRHENLSASENEFARGSPVHADGESARMIWVSCFAKHVGISGA